MSRRCQTLAGTKASSAMEQACLSSVKAFVYTIDAELELVHAEKRLWQPSCSIMALRQGLGCKRLEKNTVTFCKSRVCHSCKVACIHLEDFADGISNDVQDFAENAGGFAPSYCYHTYTYLAQSLSCHNQFLMPSGLVGLPPGTVQRALLVLLQTLMPYLADRVGGTAEAPLHSVPWGSHYSSHPPTTIPTPDVASTGACICPLCFSIFAEYAEYACVSTQNTQS